MRFDVPMFAVLLFAASALAADAPAPVLRETPLGTADAVIIASITASPDGTRLAFANDRGDGRIELVIDGKPSPARYDGLAENGIVFSPDGKRYAYAATRGDEQLVFTDAESGPACDEILSGPLFSPDGARVAYAARRGRQQFALIDGKQGPPCDAVGRLAFSRDGRHVAYGMQRGNLTSLNVDGRELGSFGGFLPRTTLAFDADGVLHAMMFRGNQLLHVTAEAGSAP